MSNCINCNIAIHANQHFIYNVLDMSPDIVTIIEEWTAQEILEEDCMCQECINLIMIELNNRQEGNVGERQLGHQSVCMCCGISISKRTGRRSYPIHENTPEWAYIANINHRQIPPNARACSACWQRAHCHREPPGEEPQVQDYILESGRALLLNA